MAPIAVMLMRAYAFSGRNKKVLFLLVSCYICLVAVDIWAFCWKIEMPPLILYSVLGGTGCFPNYYGEVMALRTGVCIQLFIAVSGADNPADTVLNGDPGHSPFAVHY
jgi:hypothetical protein